MAREASSPPVPPHATGAAGSRGGVGGNSGSHFYPSVPSFSPIPPREPCIPSAPPFPPELDKGGPNRLRQLVLGPLVPLPDLDPRGMALEAVLGKGQFGETWLGTGMINTAGLSSSGRVQQQMVIKV